MKDKILQIRMSEEEIQDLKNFTEKIGIKNVSDTVRESLKAFQIVKERSPEMNKNMIKINSSNSILWQSRFLCNGFDIQEYFQSDKKEVPEEYEGTCFDEMLLRMYDDGYFDALKKCVLESIYNDLMMSNNIDEEISNLMKNISVEFLKKI